MRYDTKYFGEVEIPKEKILTFNGAIYGFETQKEYFLVHFEEDNDGMLCLQSAQTPELSFILFNPYYILPSYEPKISEEDFKLIGAAKNDELLVYVIAVIKENGDVTVNLKSPIVINPKSGTAAQLIVEDERYTMRYPVITKEG